MTQALAARLGGEVVVVQQWLMFLPVLTRKQSAHQHQVDYYVE